MIGWSGTSVGLAGLRRRPAPGRAHPRAHRHRRRPPRCWRSTSCSRCAACTGWRWSRPTPPTCSSASSTTTARIGIEVVAERHLGIRVNHDFALVDARARCCALMREVAPAHGRRPSPPSAPTCARRRWPRRVEAELGIPLLDTVSTTVWGLLRAAGADPAPVRGWGRCSAGDECATLPPAPVPRTPCSAAPNRRRHARSPACRPHAHARRRRHASPTRTREHARRDLRKDLRRHPRAPAASRAPSSWRSGWPRSSA